MSRTRTLLKRVDAETDRLITEIKSIFEARNIRASHKDIIKWAIMFARAHILEFFNFVSRSGEDGLERFLRKIVKGGPASDSVAEHDLVI